MMKKTNTYRIAMLLSMILLTNVSLFADDLTVDGDLSVLSNLSVNGTADFDSNVSVAGTISQGGVALDDLYLNASGDTIYGPLHFATTNQAGIIITGTGTNIAIGASANSVLEGIAIGTLANAYAYGVSIGKYSLGYGSAVSVGDNARSCNGGVAVGGWANARLGGTAVGAGSYAVLGGIGLGFYADGAYTNIAIGNYASAAGGSYRIALGQQITNAIDSSIAVRGDLYLDGGTSIYYRSTCGSGAWEVFESGSTTESDPIWSSASSNYYQKAESDALYATGTPLYAFSESDPLWVSASSNYYQKSEADTLFATGTPLYVYAETDPVWIAEKSNYATGTPIYIESDPIWSSVSASYMTTSDLAQTYLDLTGGTLSGSVDVDADVEADSFTLGGETITNWSSSVDTNELKAAYVNVTGDTMSGALAMSTNRIIQLASPVEDQDAINKEFLRDVLSNLDPQGDLAMGVFTNGASGTPPLTF